MSTVKEITPEKVAALTDREVEVIIDQYLLSMKEAAYRSGKISLADALGRSLDWEELEEIEHAARRRSDRVELVSALGYAFLAYRFPSDIVHLESHLLTRPWRLRHG